MTLCDPFANGLSAGLKAIEREQRRAATRLSAPLRDRLVLTAGRLRDVELERDRLRGERDLLVREALQAGASEREIASAAGVSGPRVHQLKEES